MSVEEKRVKALSENFSAAVACLAHDVTPKHVHRLRTAIRRIESLVAYARPHRGHKQEKVLENLSALRKRAGKVRDLDVQMRLLDAIANTSTRQHRHALNELLKRKRSRQATRLSEAIADVQTAKLDGHVERLLEKAAEASNAIEKPEAPLVQARQQLARLAEETTVNASTKARVLHKVRIRIKRMRYLAELAGKTADRENFLTELKAAQDVLGDWHDWEELTFTAEKQFGDRLNCPLLVEVRALFAAKHVAACSAVAQLLASEAAASLRKQPRAAESPRALAQRA
jgi:CHAD domain-containing protein